MSIEIKNGKYTATVVCWGFTYRETKNGRQNQFAIELDIDADGEEYAPTRFTHFVGLDNEKGVEILDKQLASCGWTGDDYSKIELDTTRKVRVTIENDGEYGPKVKYIDPLDSMGGGLIARKKLDEREQASLIAKLNARAKSRPASGGTPAPTQSRPAPAQAPKPAAPRPAQAKPPAPKQPAAAAAADENSDWGFGSEGGSEGIPF